MARKATPLTNTQIKAAKPAEKEYTLQDGGGLFLVIKPSGSETMAIQLLSTIGQNEQSLVWDRSMKSPADARKRRSEYRTLIAAGTDPQEYERQNSEAEARRQGNTISKMWPHRGTK